jgi:hypothetical protein
MVDRHGDEIAIAERNILPAALTWEVAATIGLALLGFVLIWQLAVWAERREEKEERRRSTEGRTEGHREAESA